MEGATGVKPATYSARLAKLRRILEVENLDAAIINHQPHIRYLTGYTGSNGLLFVTAAEVYFYTDARYTAQAKKEVRRARVVVDERDIWKDLPKTKAATRLRIKICFQSTYVPHATYGQLRHLLPKALLVGLEQTVEPLAMIKDAEEIAAIQKAVDISDRAFAETLTCIRPGVRELDVAAELEYVMKKAGSENQAFETIVASGYRSALPHGAASTKKIKHGDFVTLDFGATYQGYVSDITRTVVVGMPTARQKKIYELVRRAQKAALDCIRAGVTGVAADRAARQVFQRAGYAKRFGHGLGHGIGLVVHEGPALSTRSTDTLAAGMVVTVEPGIYFPGWGGVRIEDDVVITSRGTKILTKADKTLISV